VPADAERDGEEMTGITRFDIIRYPEGYERLSDPRA
jgi:hypothetical protein